MSLEVSQQEAAKYLLKIKRAALDYRSFIELFYPEYEIAGFQSELIEVLDKLEKDALVSPGGNPIRKLLVNMPPRHAKSFYATINFPAYCMGRRPYRELMTCAYNDVLAATFGRNVRDIVVDPKMLKVFPKLELSRETRAVDFWKTMAGGAYYAVGLGGTTVGRGANGLFVDDPIKSRQEAESTTIRRQVWDYYISSLLSRRQPDRDGQPPFELVILQRWHPDDPAGRIMETPSFKRGEWMHLNFKALSKKDGGVYIRRNDLPKEDPRYVPTKIKSEKTGKDIYVVAHRMNQPDKFVSGEGEVSLWPARFPVEVLQKIREEMGEREFAALYQQEPYIVGGNLIKEQWFRRHPSDQPRPEFHALAIAVDTAAKTKTVNDYSVATLGGITTAGDIHVLKVWREKLEFPDLKRKLIGINASYRGMGLRGIWVEDTSNGTAILQELKNESGIAILPWRPGAVDKVARVNSVLPMVEGGRVWVPEDADWLPEWFAELAAFPGGKHDDQVDSLVILLDVLSRMVVTGMKSFNIPIGTFLADKALGGDLLFTDDLLSPDPNGWVGKGGFGAELAKATQWKGWGNL